YPRCGPHPYLCYSGRDYVHIDWCQPKNQGRLFMSKRNTRCLYAAFVAGALTVAASGVQAQDKEEVIGLQCDRTGATQMVGTTLCPAYHDYVALVHSNGGIEGYKIKVLEIDHEYKVPPGMEAHERFKKEGAIIDSVYGTPHIGALNKKL